MQREAWAGGVEAALGEKADAASLDGKAGLECVEELYREMRRELERKAWTRDHRELKGGLAASRADIMELEKKSALALRFMECK